MAAPIHRYADCPAFRPGDDVHETDDDPRPVTCPTCREDLGLPEESGE